VSFTNKRILNGITQLTCMINHSELRSALIKIVGEANYAESELDLLCYSSDVAALPPEIFKVYGIKKPICVVKPNTTEQVAAIVRLADKYGVAITPRGGGSSGLGGAVPVKDGVVIDLTGMKQMLELNESKKTITVQPGITWKELIDFLDKKGLQPGTYPSSAYSATIGGFIATGGYFGVGAPKYGPISNRIVNLEVVLPNGDIINTAEDGIPAADIPMDCSWVFTGSEGIFGIVTKATLKVYPKNIGFEVCAIAFDSLEDAYIAVNEALKERLTPHTLHIVDKNFLDNARKIEDKTPEAEALVVVAFEAPTTSEAKEYTNKMLKICATKGGSDLGLDVAKREWEERFKVELVFKRLGPTLLLIELLAPLAKVQEIIKKWNYIAEKHGLAVSHFGMLSSDSLVNLMPMVLVDERNKGEFVKTVAILMKMLEAGLKLGGKIHSVGVHYATYVENKTGVNIKELRRIKSAVDPKNLMNPYKVVMGRLSPRAFKFAMGFMARSPAWLDSFALKVAGATPIVKIFRT